MRFKKYLIQEKVESFRIDRQQDDVFQTHFRTATQEFYFEAYLDSKTKSWHVAFTRYTPLSLTKRTHYETMSDLSQEETFQVVSGLRLSLMEFIKRYDPHTFVFIAEDVKHAKAYGAMAKIISRKGNYKLQVFKTGTDTSYTFEKR